MPAYFVPFALAVLGTGSVVVRSADDRLELRASGAPLFEVLDELALRTGIAIVYEGARPREAVSVDLAGCTAVEAVLRLLEGRGLNYAFVMDETRTAVRTLLLAGRETTVAPIDLARSLPAPGPPHKVPDAGDAAAEPESVGEAVEADDGRPPDLPEETLNEVRELQRRRGLEHNPARSPGERPRERQDATPTPELP